MAAGLLSTGCDRQPPTEPSAAEMLAAIAPLQGGLRQERIAIRKRICRPAASGRYECEFVARTCGDNHRLCLGSAVMRATFTKKRAGWIANNPRGPVGALPGYVHTAPSSKSKEDWDREWEEVHESIVLPIDPRHRKLERTPGWLAGYWVYYKQACGGSDSGISFNADLTYSDHGTAGSYTLPKDSIRMVTTEIYDWGSPEDRIGGVDISELQLIGPNEVELSDWRDEQARPLKLHRCPPMPIE